MPTVESNLAHNPGIQSAQAGQVTVQYGTYDLIGTQAEDAALVLGLVRLPAQHRIVSATFENEDLDTGATALVDLGIEDTFQDPADTTDLTLFAAAVDVQTAGIVEYKTKAMLEFASVNYDRYVVLSIDTVAATGLAGAVAFELVTRPDLSSHEGNYS